jgi:predicted DNA-binding transcriptional regulator YafY
MKENTLKKWIGQTVEIIYQDKLGNITQRKIEIHGFKNGLVRASCLTTGSPRVFRMDSILAWQLAKANHTG